MRKSRLFILPAFLLFLNPTLSAADPAGIPVSGGRVFLQALPAGGDGFYAVWNASGTTDGLSIFAQRVSVAQVPQWGAGGKELVKGIRESGLWDSASDGQGGFLLTSAEQNKLMLRHIGPDGKILWEKSASSFTNDSPATSVISVPDGHGGLFLAWAQGTSDHSTVLVQRWNSSGQSLWAKPGIRPAASDPHEFHPLIMPDGLGGILVAWKTFESDVSAVRAQRITAEGQVLWPEPGVGVQRPAGSLNERILMAPAGNGGLVSAWAQGVQGINRLYFQHIDSKGIRSWSGGGITGSPPIIEQWNPVLLSNNDGNLWIGWEEVPEGADPKVKIVRRGPPNGDAWPAGEISLAPGDGSQGRLDLALDGAGGLLASWIDSRGSAGLYLQHVDAQGRLKYVGGKAVATNLKHPKYPHLLLAAPGYAAIVWMEEINSKQWELHYRIADLEHE